MNDRVAALERLVELARGLARDDYAVRQMCRRICDYTGSLLDGRTFHVAVAADDGTMRPEYHVAEGKESNVERMPAPEGMTIFPLRHGDRELGVVLLETDPAMTQSAAADLETAMDFFALAIAGVDRLRATERRIDRDSLTNLYNRNYGTRRLREELQHAARTHSQICTLLVDVDGVDELNTKYGHPTGDSAIRTVGDALKSICRHSDVLCRYAGDRFLLIYPDFSGDDPMPVARRIRTQIEMRVLPVPGGAIGLKASIGAVISADGIDANALMQQTESELLREKAQRRRRA